LQEDAAQRPEGELSMKGNGASDGARGGFLAKDDMATALPDDFET
jgi:hypothetical protein